MLTVFMVTFREGVEAFLITSVILLFLKQTSRFSLLFAAKLGAATGLMMSIAIGLFLADVGAIRALYEGFLALGALASVGMCFLQLNGHGKKTAVQMRTTIMALPVETRLLSHIAMFGFSLLMIAREGIEATIMLAGMAQTSSNQHALLAGLLGLSAAIALGFAWMHYGRTLDLSKFFRATGAFMGVFSLQLAIYAFHEFSEAQAIPFLDNAKWHLLTEPYGPDGAYGQLLSYCLVVVPAAVLVISSIRQRVTFATRPRVAIPQPTNVEE